MKITDKQGHTPGPWESIGTTVKTNSFGGVWTLQSLGLNIIHDDTDNADARLMAAAPELLTACKLATKLLREMDNNKASVFPVSSKISHIENIIAKAEGR